MAFQVYEHTQASPILQKALHNTLPYSINLVYRTQHRNRTPDAHILATFPENAELGSDAEIPNCWAAAYYDRSMRPETELWIFSSGELPSHTMSQHSTNTTFCPTCRMSVLAIIDYISALPNPPLHPENLPSLELAKQHEKEHPESGPGVRYPKTPGSYTRHLLLPSIVTLGACNAQLVQICHEAGLVRDEFPGPDDLLNKFLFKVADLPATKELPDQLRWGAMRQRDIAAVQARTPIPRPTKTLMSLESVGVFDRETDTPVAWTFLGLDGSLTTLHVESQWRRRGIAKAVAAKMFRENAPALAVDAQGTAWAHADVYVGNVQSESVCRSLGGKEGWKIFWVRLDVGKAGQLGAPN